MNWNACCDVIGFIDTFLFYLAICYLTSKIFELRATYTYVRDVFLEDLLFGLLMYLVSEFLNYKSFIDGVGAFIAPIYLLIILIISVVVSNNYISLRRWERPMYHELFQEVQFKEELSQLGYLIYLFRYFADIHGYLKGVLFMCSKNKWPSHEYKTAQALLIDAVWTDVVWYNTDKQQTLGVIRQQHYQAHLQHGPPLSANQ